MSDAYMNLGLSRGRTVNFNELQAIPTLSDQLERPLHQIQDNTVYKAGRTTHLTVGEVFRADPSIKVNYPVTDGREGNHFFTLQGRAILARGLDHRLFATHSDSGAVVVDGDARLLGLVFAFNKADPSGLVHGAAFVTPMSVILRDAKEQLERIHGKDVKIEVV
jgi:hypothetical protein